MRKALVIIFAVAVLGGLGFYANKNKADNNLNTSGSSTTAVNPSQASSGSTASSSGNSGPVQLKDGTYSGGTADTPYGIVQVAAVISGGKISDIKFLQMPFEENRSQQVTNMAEPQLKQNTLDAQSSNIDFVSGATSTSYGYKESLQAALDKAKVS
jgi:uncharacterized protein with FMN-binding domain